jgi:protein-tyrosine phosphatase
MHAGGTREDMKEARVGVLFVCLGNICRSPLAEAVFRKHVEAAGLDAAFDIDSAGTSGYHDGETADARTIQEAGRRGVRVTSISRRVTEHDLTRFDHVIVMDGDNLSKVRRLASRSQADVDVRLLREFDPKSNGDDDVPDPWYGGPGDFTRVHDIIERSSLRLLEHLRELHGL